MTFTAEQLLEPISPESPSGADLSFSPELDAISQARRFDDPSLAQGEWITDLKEADWPFVVRRCVDLLQTTSKDLRLAVWLAEAAVKTDGLRGLGEALRTLAGLCQDYWDVGLYPESDGDDHDQRIGNLSWILARMPSLLRETPITDGKQGRYSTIDFETARKAASSSNGGAVTGPKLADLEAARRHNSAAFVDAFGADIALCMAALGELEAVADERLGTDSPGFSAARNALVDLQRMVPTGSQAVAAPEAGAPALSALATEDAGEAYGVGSAAPVAPAGPPGTIQTRAQALAQLRAVAQFFRRTEPHSPVSYYADKAADAGEQNLHDWLKSVVKDGATMAHIEELLGVQRRND